MAQLNCKILSYKTFGRIFVPNHVQTNRCVAQKVATNWANAKPLSEMPAYGKWEFFRSFMPGGKFHNKDFIRILGTVRQQLGDIAFTPGILGQPNRVVTFHPDDFETVFRNEGQWPIRNGFEVLREYRLKKRKNYFQGTIGVLLSNGKDWGIFRSVVNPVLMQPKAVKRYLTEICSVSEEFVEKIRDIRDPNTLEMPDDFVKLIHCWTLENVAIIALDKQLGLISGKGQNAQEAEEFFKHINIFFDEFTNLEVRPPFWKYFATPSYKKVIKSLDYITDFVDKHIQASLEDLKSKKKSGLSDEKKGILERLLKVDKKIATVMAIDMFFAGVDTTTTTLTGLLLCLSKSPEKQTKLREEILQILPHKNSELTPENTKNLPYLRACIKESLRLYPLGPGAIRCTSRDMVLSNYRVPKGTEISMINEFLLRDPKYFEKPDEFIPERWLRQHVVRATHPFVYFPFGFGARSCVGKRLAEMELEIGIMKLLQNFTVQFNYPTENIFKNNLIYVPDKPLKFKFIDL